MKINMAFAGILAGLVTLFAPVGSADAVPSRIAPESLTSGTICQTGGRGMPEYDRTCLRTGTLKDGALLWLNVPAGRKGHEVRDGYDRRSQCRYASEFGGIRVVARELFFDVAYDRYTNHGAVLSYAGTVAALDCAAMGYRV